MALHDGPGLSIERRALLAAPLGLCLPGGAAGGEDDELEFRAFAKRCEVLAQEVLGGAAHDPALALLEHLGARVDPTSAPKGELVDFGGFDPEVKVGRVHGRPPCLVIMWRLDPGAVLPPHNHTPGLVMSLGLQGECRVRHFEIDGDAPRPGAEGGFRVRETRSRLLRPGLATTLSPTRDNLHTFEAGPGGALGIDVNVFLPSTDEDWSMVELGARETTGYERLYPARWIGKPR